MCINRQEELHNLQTYIKDVDNEITLILQSLQWDRSTLLAEKPSVTCSINAGHILPPETQTIHENQCWLKSQGYVVEDKMLPEPLHSNANTIVKLSSEDIKLIIESASNNNPSFKKGKAWSAPAPLTLERIQATFTVDERRAIHDAVVASSPACHDLSDLALFDVNAVKSESKTKSRMEILAELRDMKRRRTKYRVAAKTQNYSDVLRDVIKTQMELYTDTQVDVGSNLDSNTEPNIFYSDKPKEPQRNVQIKRERSLSIEKERSKHRKYDYDRKRYDERNVSGSRLTCRDSKRQRSNSRERRHKRDDSYNDREKHRRKDEDDYKKTSLSKKFYDEREDRDKHDDRNKRFHDKRRYDDRDIGKNKYEDRHNTHSRDYERSKVYDQERRSNDNYRSDRHKGDGNRYEKSKRSKRDSSDNQEKRYWNNDEVKVKKEFDEDQYDSHHYRRNGNSSRDYREVRVKQERIEDNMEYE